MNNHLFLNAVERPSRYVAGEYNLKTIKPDAAVKWCFAFPDVYEVGMSYYGMTLLYGLLNQDSRSSCERVFAPWVDAEARLRELQAPLTSLETGSPLTGFDVLGFTLQHEMNYTNVLTILDLGGLPLLQSERGREHPLVIGGGTCVYNPEPMADFFDAFVIGDGEEVISEINALLAELPPHTTERGKLLRELARIDGVYVPSLYEVAYREDGAIQAMRPLADEARMPVEARRVSLEGSFYETSPLIPSAEVIHDRAGIEIMRGCVRGCRFCQAGFVTRPIRERSASEIADLSRQALEKTGVDNLSLLSLSSADHQNLPGIVDGLLGNWDPAVSLSLPSLRIDGFDLEVATRLAELHQSGFTFAPEAGTDRLRHVINKDLGEPEIFHTLEGLFQRGWQTIKLYFQIGLPTETEEDLKGLVDLVRKVRDLLTRKVAKRPKLNISINPFTPKSFTPFQWSSQDDLATLKEKIRFIERLMPRGPVNASFLSPEKSMLEGILARGDRRLSAVILHAWRLGRRFDDWSECYSYAEWMRAFSEVGIDPHFYNLRAREKDEALPWDVVSCGVGKEYLWHEYLRSQQEKVTADCRERQSCTICGACSDERHHDLHPALPDKQAGIAPASKPLSAGATTAQAIRVRLNFSKAGPARWISQLDLIKTTGQILRRAHLPLMLSQGFTQRPKISFPMGLPVGLECLSEWVDIEIEDPRASDSMAFAAEVIERLNRASPPGIRFHQAILQPVQAPTLVDTAIRLKGMVRWIPETPDKADLSQRLSDAIEKFHAEKTLVSHRPAKEKKPAKSVDLAPFIESIQIANSQDGAPMLLMDFAVRQAQTIRPDETVLALLGRGSFDPVFMDAARAALILSEEGMKGV